MDLLESETMELVKAMPDVCEYRENLRVFNRQWVKITLTGKINSNKVASTLIEFMETTQGKFLALQDNLIHELIVKNCEKASREMANLSRVAIDILKRNLFERTADVGFLATDDDIVRFLSEADFSGEARSAMELRLQEYRDKYTVYDEIIVFDSSWNVRAHLDKASDISRSQDPLLGKTVLSDGYLETFRASDMRPGRGDSLIYSHRITDPASGACLGVLCLCFDFEGEMKGIFDDLVQKIQAAVCILDEDGRVISSSDQSIAATGSSLGMALDREFVFSRTGKSGLLSKTSRTNGYQGFYGLPWFGHVIYPVDRAFGASDAVEAGASCDVRDTNLFAGSLKRIDDDADEILSDLGLVVLNGEVMAAKQIVNADPVICQEANALPPVLDAIHQVGERIRGVFAESISSLLNTVLSSRLDDMRFQASLAIDIMDRNLYERANDCRWWALNSTFRHALSMDAMTERDRNRLEEILVYINSLYTVYTNLILYDATGKVVAASNKKGNVTPGMRLQSEYVARCLRLGSSAEYCVSDFARFEECGMDGAVAPFTYVYNAAVFHSGDSGKAAGGIALVFDGEPQFKAMLEDALPRDEDGTVVKNSLALYLDRERRVISSSSDDWRPGEVFPLGGANANLGNGEQCSDIASINGRRYVVGCAMSKGYREFKRDGIYENDVLAAVLVEV